MTDRNTRKRLQFRNQSSPSSFSLMILHKHMFGITPAQSHGAKADCLALLRITAALGSEWIQLPEDVGLTNNLSSFPKDYNNHESCYNEYDDDRFDFLRIMQRFCLHPILSSYCNSQLIFNQILFSGNFFMLEKYLGFPIFSQPGVQCFSEFWVVKYLKCIHVSRVS